MQNHRRWRRTPTDAELQEATVADAESPRAGRIPPAAVLAIRSAEGARSWTADTALHLVRPRRTDAASWLHRFPSVHVAGHYLTALSGAGDWAWRPNELRNCLQPSAATSSPSMLSRIWVAHLSVEEAAGIKDMFEKRDLNRVYIGLVIKCQFVATEIHKVWRQAFRL